MRSAHKKSPPQAAPNQDSPLVSLPTSEAALGRRRKSPKYLCTMHNRSRLARRLVESEPVVLFAPRRQIGLEGLERPENLR